MKKTTTWTARVAVAVMMAGAAGSAGASEAEGGQGASLNAQASSRAASVSVPAARPGTMGKPSWAAPLATYSSGALADLISTEIALQRPNAYESNPLLANRGVRLGAKAAEVAALTLLDRQLAKRSPRGAKILRVMAIASRCALAAHNLRQGN